MNAGTPNPEQRGVFYMKRKLMGRLVSALSASALAVSGMGVLPAAPVSAASLTGQDA